MTLAPDARLVRIVAAWTASAVAVVGWPELAPAWGAVLASLALLAAIDAARLLRQPRLSVVRRLPERALMGCDASIELALENPGRRTVVADVVDELPSSLATAEPWDAGVRVAPGETATLVHPIRPDARGDVVLGPVLVLARSPLGLWRRRATVGGGATLRVYPDVRRYLRADPLRARRVHQELGVRPTRERGEGMDFESLRDYVVGDDVRRVDWAATARRGRPVTRVYQHERHNAVIVALDASRVMGSLVGDRTKLDHAVDAALALAYGAMAAGDRVGMVVFDDAVRGAIEPAPRRHMGAFLDLLTPVVPRLVEADFVALARRLASGRQRRALVVVLSDFVDADPGAVLEPMVVLARRHRVLFTAVRDRVYDGLVPGARDDDLALYRRLVLDDLLGERERTLAHLRRAGVDTLDLPPERITAPLVNRYLAMRGAAAA